MSPDVAILVVALVAFAGGAASGAIGWSLWLVRRLNRPENAAKLLRGAYAQAHPHFLQRSATDDTPVCPLCGYSEERAAKAREVQ